jgi:spermidine/putrescine-binding protein
VIQKREGENVTHLDRPLTRAGFLRASALSAVGLWAAGCGGGTSGGGGGSNQLAWLTWSDHYANDQLKAIAGKSKLSLKPELMSDNAPTFLKVKQTGHQYDMVSADALWVPKYHSAGLTESFDLTSVPVSSQLYSIARDIPFWKDGSNYMCYPFSWSTVQIYYNPKYVRTPPDSWQALLDPKYKNKISLENIPTDIMAIAAKATGATKPYEMDDQQIGDAKNWLKQFKPNVLKLAAQNNEVVRSLADESAWIGITNLGTEERVKDANGPTVKSVYPSEGTIGFVDAEQLIKGSPNKDKFPEFLEAAEQANWIAANFVANGRPLFNEKAYKLLVQQGHKDRADRVYYNDPERAMKMTIKGPAKNEQAYADAFNEVFAA